MSSIVAKREQKPRLIALAFAAIFLGILLVNSLQANGAVLSMRYYPTVTKSGQPFEVDAIVTNTGSSPHQYLVKMYVNGLEVLSATSSLGASGSQAFTYTRAGPAVGSTSTVYAQATDLSTGKTYTQSIAMPPDSPDLLLSFSAFAAFATSLFSTSTMTSTATIAYYESAMGAAAPKAAILPSSALAVLVSVAFLGLIVFLELTDSAYGRLGTRFQLLRTRFGLLGFTLLLVFAGIVFTRVVLLLV